MVDKKKTAKSKQAEAVEVVEVKAPSEDKPRGGWGEKLIWGVLFIAVGILLLLGNIGVLTVELSSLWRLWPVLIIVAGLSVLSLRGWVGGLVYGVAALGIGVLVWATMVGPLSQQASTSVRDEVSIAKSNDEVESLSVSIKAGAVSLDVGSHGDDAAVKGVLESDFAKINHSSSISDGSQKVMLNLEGSAQWWLGDSRNKFAVNLNNTLPIDLDIDTGAASVKADLSDVVLRTLNIDSGASSVDLKLGSRSDESRVVVDVGVSSVKIQVPATSGVRLELDAGLSSKNIPEGYEKIDDDTYLSKNYSSSSKKITLVVDIGLSSLKIREY